MNEQETIKFILQNSSEPVIKNPILQTALREPRPMAQGGRLGYKPGGIVEPGVMYYAKKENITIDQFKKEFNKFQKLKKNMGTDAEFAEYLNKNYKTVRGETFNIKNIQPLRKTYNLKATVKGGQPPPVITERFKKITEFLEELVPKLNAAEKYISKEQLSTMVEKKFNLKPKITKKGYKVSKLDLYNYPVVKNLDKIGDKIETTLKNMLMEDKPLNNFYYKELAKRTGTAPATITAYLKDSPTYEVIADQGADALKTRFNLDTSHGFLKKFSFSDQLTKALEMEQGMPQFTGMGDKSYASSPKNKVMEFAKRSWNQNQGKGDIKFFDKNGKLITWDYGKKLPYKEVSFSYNKGKKHNIGKLNDLDYLKKNFFEVYKIQTDLNNLATKKIDNPFKKGTKISVKNLIKKIQIDNYRWKPTSGTLDILHGNKGVGGEPFTNLSYNTKDINQVELGLKRSLDVENITKADYNKALKNLYSSFKGKDLNQVIINRQFDLAEDIIKRGPVKTKLEGRERYKQVSDLLVELGCGKATGSRVGFAEGSSCLKKGQKKMNELLIKGTGTQAERGVIVKIVQGGSDLMKGLSPKEMFKIRNLIGPAALSFMGAIEGGIISNDVINKGTPIKEALGANWMTKWAMPKTLMEYQIQDLRKTGKLDSPLLKNFAQTTEQMAELDRLYNVLDSNKAIGMSTIDTEKQIKELQDEITSSMKKNKMTRASLEPGSAALLEFQNRLTEKEAKQLASTKESNISDIMRTGTLDMGNLKDPYKPMFGFDELKPKENIFRVDPKKGRMSKTRTVKDYTLPTYKNMTEEPVTEEERVYQQKRYGLKPEQRIEDYTDAETGVNLAKDLELKKKWTQALYQPGMMGTQDKFKSGGRVSFSGGGMGRRGFLKLLAALGIGTAGAKSGISLFGKAVGKKAVSTAGVDIVSGTQGMPSWFPSLVNKIIKEGDDVTTKLATQERQVVHTKKLPDGEEVTVYRDIDTGDIRVDYDSIDNMGQEPISLQYTKGEEVYNTGKGYLSSRKTIKEPDTFGAAESEPAYIRNGPDPDDSEIQWQGSEYGTVDDLFSDTSRIKNYAESKKPTIKEIVTRKRKTDKVKKINTDEGAQVDYSVDKYGDGPDIDLDYDYASGGRVSYFDGGIVSLKKKW